MHIVALAGWYPVRHDLYLGDFVQRHLNAISELSEVTLIHINRSAGNLEKSFERRTSGNLNEIIIYIAERRSSLISFIEYYLLVNRELKRIRQRTPIDLVHVHVVKMNGLFAWVYNWLTNTPYIITEHSTAYVDGEWEKSGFLKKRLIRAVFKKALAVHCVSNYLADQLRYKLSLKNKIVVIPNVVDTRLFFPLSSQNEVVTFIHVSTLTFQKNIAQTLNAFGMLKRLGIIFRFKIVGPASLEVSDLIKKNHIENEVVCLNEIPQSQLAGHMAAADALVLFSRYETFGCVVIESLACGKPVVVSNLPVLQEIVHPFENGILVRSDEVEGLANALKDIAQKKYPFDSQKLSSDAALLFSYPVVARQFLKWYESVLKHD